MEAKRDWDNLISLLKIRGTGAGPDEAYARRGNWQAIEAARLLASHADETVPLLIARLAKPDRQNVKWLYYALGRCGTKEAVAALEAHALRERNCWRTNAVVYALSLAGEKGEVALTQLEKQVGGNLQGSIIRYRQGKIGDQDEDIRFPELRHVPALPKALKELEMPNNEFDTDAE